MLINFSEIFVVFMVCGACSYFMHRLEFFTRFCNLMFDYIFCQFLIRESECVKVDLST